MMNSKNNKRRRESSGESDSDSDESISIESSSRLHGLTRTLGPSSTSRSRHEFTSKERQSIVEYLVKADAYNEVLGIRVWKNMSLKIPTHTWQSLKEHFLKKIMPFINVYKLSSEIVEKFRKGVARNKRQKKKPSILNAYSKLEDEALLQYVAEYGKNALLGGNVFWRKMSQKNIIPGRTWHSIRERYVKYLKNQPRNGATSPESSNEERSIQGSSSDTDEDADSSCKQREPKCSSPEVDGQSSSLKPSKEMGQSLSATSETSESIKIKKPSMLEILVSKKNQRAEKDLLLQNRKSHETEQIQDLASSANQINVSPNCIVGVLDLNDATSSSLPVTDFETNEAVEQCAYQPDPDWSDDGLHWRGANIANTIPRRPVSRSKTKKVKIVARNVSDNTQQSKLPEKLSSPDGAGNGSHSHKQTGAILESQVSTFDFLGDFTFTEVLHAPHQGHNSQENELPCAENTEFSNMELTRKCGSHPPQCEVVPTKPMATSDYASTCNKGTQTNLKVDVSVQTDPVQVFTPDEYLMECKKQKLPLLSLLKKQPSSVSLLHHAKVRVAEECPSPESACLQPTSEVDPPRIQGKIG